MPQARDEAGNIWEVDAQGNPVRLVRAAQQMPDDPTFPTKGPAAQAALRGQTIDNSIKGATAGATITKANAEAAGAGIDNAARIAELEAKGFVFDPAQNKFVRDPNFKPIPTAAEAQEVTGKLSRLHQLIGQINEVEALYDAGPGQTKGVAGIRDYLPTDSNAAFDAAGAALSQQGLAAFRVPGTGAVSDRDAMMFDRANLPTASTRDAAVEQQLKQLRMRVEAEMEALGQPKPEWKGVDPGAVYQQDSAVPMQASTGGMTGAKTRQEPDYETRAIMDGLFFQGANAAQINAALEARGEPFRPVTDAELGDMRAYMSDLKRRGKKYEGSPFSVPLKTTENDIGARISGSIPGAVGAGYANAATFGAGDMMNPQAMDAIRGAHPYASMGGEVLGALTATKGIGMGASAAGSRFAPQMTGSFMNTAPAARMLATDTAYGMGRGGVTDGPGGVLTGGLTGTVGSTAGQGVGKAIGAGLGGMSRSAPAQYLRDLNIPMTVGQQAGGIAKSLEDKATSIPFIGDIIAKRRLEGLNAFDSVAMNQGGSPIGATAQNIGERGIRELDQAKSAAYRRHLDPAQIDMLNDPAIVQELARAQQAARAIPNVKPSMPADFAESSLRNRIESPIGPNGTMTGRDFQESYRGLARDGRARANSDYGHEVGSVTRQGQDLLANALERQNPGAFNGFKAANTANRNIRTLEDAVRAAKSGSRSGQLQTFTPSQLVDAGWKSANKFPGPRPFAELADAGQQVLPSSIPDSGTAGRLMQMAAPALLPATLGGAGAGADYAGLSDGGWQKGLLAGLALAAGGSKNGQKVLSKALFDRPAALKHVGGRIRKRRGLFGTAAVPLLLEAQQ